MAAVLAVCCVCCGPYRLLCGGGVPCGGKHIIIEKSKTIVVVEQPGFGSPSSGADNLGFHWRCRRSYHDSRNTSRRTEQG